MVSGISTQQGAGGVQNLLEALQSGSSQSTQSTANKGGCNPCTNCGACSSKIQDPSTVTQEQLKSPIDLLV